MHLVSPLLVVLEFCASRRAVRRSGGAAALYFGTFWASTVAVLGANWLGLASVGGGAGELLGFADAQYWFLSIGPQLPLVAALLCRLPVLAGARVLFYLSCEQWHDDRALLAPRYPAWDAARLEAELSIYRAQLQARAVENNVWLVKSNVSACPDDPELGSHGMSSIIDPTGRVRAEAGTATEEVVSFEVGLEAATAKQVC